MARAMNILYKYCDQRGIKKILKSLELKLPYISEVNDPFECFPFIYCPNDKLAIETRFLSVLKHRNMLPPAGYNQKLDEQFEKGELQNFLVGRQREYQKEWNRCNCLLSVSRNARKTVMWAHYADKHKGVVIGIDFDNIFPNCSIGKMYPVDYSKQRPKRNILEKPKESVRETARKVLMTKSKSWKYEEEFRGIFCVDSLKKLQRQRLACIKDFNGKETWFLRLNPESIRKVVFGLYIEDSLKLDIKKLIERPELQHVKLYHVEESETYTFKLVEENR
jgi:hypothetical protein